MKKEKTDSHLRLLGIHYWLNVIFLLDIAYVMRYFTLVEDGYGLFSFSLILSYAFTLVLYETDNICIAGILRHGRGSRCAGWLHAGRGR